MCRVRSRRHECSRTGSGCARAAGRWKERGVRRGGTWMVPTLCSTTITSGSWRSHTPSAAVLVRSVTPWQTVVSFFVSCVEMALCSTGGARRCESGASIPTSAPTDLLGRCFSSLCSAVFSSCISRICNPPPAAASPPIATYRFVCVTRDEAYITQCVACTRCGRAASRGDVPVGSGTR